MVRFRPAEPIDSHSMRELSMESRIHSSDPFYCIMDFFSVSALKQCSMISGSKSFVEQIDFNLPSSIGASIPQRRL